MVYIYFDEQSHDVTNILRSGKFYGYEWCAVENCGGGIYRVTAELNRRSECDDELFIQTLKHALEDEEIKDVIIHGVSDLLEYTF